MRTFLIISRYMISFIIFYMKKMGITLAESKNIHSCTITNILQRCTWICSTPDFVVVGIDLPTEMKSEVIAK